MSNRCESCGYERSGTGCKPGRCVVTHARHLSAYCDEALKPIERAAEVPAPEEVWVILSPEGFVRNSTSSQRTRDGWELSGHKPVRYVRADKGER